jgi:hypothetical protein
MPTKDTCHEFTKTDPYRPEIANGCRAYEKPTNTVKPKSTFFSSPSLAEVTSPSTPPSNATAWSGISLSLTPHGHRHHSPSLSSRPTNPFYPHPT